MATGPEGLMERFRWRNLGQVDRLDLVLGQYIALERAEGTDVGASFVE